MCEIYWQTANTTSASLWGGNVQSKILKRGDQKKNSSCGDLKSSFTDICLGGLNVFLVKKDCKISYGFEEEFQMLILACFSCQKAK